MYVCWIKYVRIRVKVAMTLVGWLDFAFHVHLFAYTLSLRCGIHVILYLYVFMCAAHNFNFVLIELPFIRSTILCVFLYIYLCMLQKPQCVGWSYSTKLCFLHLYTHTHTHEKTVFHKVYCVPKIICFFLISPLLFLCSILYDKETTNFRCFHAMCQKNECIITLWKCVKEIYKIIRCAQWVWVWVLKVAI